MCALCVDPHPMGHKRARLEELFPLSTPLHADRWETALHEAGVGDRFAEVPKGLRTGFSIGLDTFELNETFSPANHYKSQEAHDFIFSKYTQEVNLGRVSPGFLPSHAEALFGPFRTAPLNVITSAGGKLRVTLDLSYPRNDPSISSINSLIDTSAFQCEWGTFADCWLLVADAPPGTEVAVFNVESAFRIIPTRPEDWPLLAVNIGGFIHYDFRLNFGASCAPGIFGKVADAIVQIYLNQGADAILKWVDDFLFFRYPLSNTRPFSYSYDETLIWSTAKHLGWPWAPDKHSPFSHTFKYIGFEWSLVDKTVVLPTKKKEKYLAKLDEWSSSNSISLKTTESLIGTLNHVCLVIPHGRSHLPAFYAFRTSFPSEGSHFIKHRPSKPVLHEIDWWRTTLSSKWCGVNIKRPPNPLDIQLFVDASTSWGIGLVLDDKWLAWPLKEGWQTEGRDIGWAEMVAVDLAVRTLIAGHFVECHVILRSDNAGVVGAFSAGYSRSSQQNLVLRHIVDSFQAHGIWLTLEWVPSESNLADKPSRGIFPPRSNLFPFPPAVPQYLKPFVRFSIRHNELEI